jgi:AraC-like DNA-binding protein
MLAMRCRDGSDLGRSRAFANDCASALLDRASEITTSHVRPRFRAPGGRAEMIEDALSDVLKTVRLTGAVFFGIAARAPWVAEQPTPRTILPLVLPGAEHLISYHVITEGRCYAGLVGQEPQLVEAGEIIVFTRGDSHVVSSTPGMRAQAPNPAAMYAQGAQQQPFFAKIGDEGPFATKMICGFFACDARPFNPLLDNLPPVIKVAAGEGADSRWLGQFIHVAAAESAERRAGGNSVLARLSELMFIEVVRRHLESLPPEQAGWLAGLRDSFVGKALSLMHARPAANWTIEDLAREVGLSRSVLAERFADLVGMPPMQYLASWRMQIASGLLAGGNANIARVAAETGYGSEAAFSRAFKRMVGESPSEHRRRATG